MTTVVRLPPEILARIIYEQLCIEKLSACLRLRLVNRYFAQEVLRAFIEGGIFDRRFYSKLIQLPSVNAHFALYYLEAYVRNARREFSRLKQHNTKRIKRQPVVTESSDTSSASESETSIHSILHGVGPLGTTKRGRRVRWSQDLLTSAIVLLVSNNSSPRGPASPTNAGQPVPASNDEESWTIWTRDLCSAIVTLLGPRGSLLFLGSNGVWARSMDGEERHLAGKSAEFYALIAAVHSRNFPLACKWIEQFRIDHRRVQRWLRRLDSDWERFAWNSNKREKVWLEVLAACLTIAVKQEDSALFTYLINLEPGIFTPAFTFIRFSERNIVEQVINAHRLDYFQILADKGWCLTKSGDNGPNLLDQYEGALAAALNLNHDLPQRFDILRILLIMGQDWQRHNNFRRLLLQCAKDNDIKLATLMLDLLTTESIKWSPSDSALYVESRYEERRDTLDMAEMHGSLELVHFLIQHRRRFNRIVPGSESYIDPKRAIGQIIKRGEPSHMECFKEIVFAARTEQLCPEFTKAAAKLSTEALAILAQYIDLDAPEHDVDLIVIEEVSNLSRESSDNASNIGASAITRSMSRTSRTSASSDEYGTRDGSVITEWDGKGPSIGESALASALRALNWKNARYLVETLGVKLTWGSIKGVDVWESNESGMEALAELRKLLADHGMILETKVIYVPVFHPGDAASSARPMMHEIEDDQNNSRSDEGSNSHPISDTVSYV